MPFQIMQRFDQAIPKLGEVRLGYVKIQKVNVKLSLYRTSRTTQRLDSQQKNDFRLFCGKVQKNNVKLQAMQGFG